MNAREFYEAVVRMRTAQIACRETFTDQQEAEKHKAEQIIDAEIERVQAILLKQAKEIVKDLDLDRIV